MKKYLFLALHSIALVAVLTLITDHFTYQGFDTILFAGTAIMAGYLLGTWTCHLHTKQTGFWITVLVFVLLNLVHSMIDGASVGGMSSFTGGIALLSHEFGRQPALYIVLWGMLTPFVNHKGTRLLLVPLVVTGTWAIGAYAGYETFTYINNVPLLASLADMAAFLFLGDILHHLYEEYRKLTRKDSCCHS